MRDNLGSPLHIKEKLFSDKLLKLKPVQRALLLNRLCRRAVGLDSAVTALEPEVMRLARSVTSKGDVAKLKLDLDGASLKLKEIGGKLDAFCQFAGVHFTSFHPTGGYGRFSGNEIEARMHMVYRKFEMLKNFEFATRREIAIIESA